MKNESIAIVIQLLLVRKNIYILNNPLYLKVHLLLVDWLFSIYLPKTKGLVSNLSSDDLRVGPLGFDKHFPAVDGVPIHIFFRGDMEEPPVKYVGHAHVHHGRKNICIHSIFTHFVCSSPAFLWVYLSCVQKPKCHSI